MHFLAHIKSRNVICPVITITWNDGGNVVSVTVVTENSIAILFKGQYELVRTTTCEDRMGRSIAEHDVLIDRDKRLLTVVWDDDFQRMNLVDTENKIIGGLNKQGARKLRLVGNLKTDPDILKKTA